MTACGATEDRTGPSAQELLAESRRIASEYVQAFSAFVGHAGEMGNILRGFTVCRYDSVELLSKLARTSGTKIARVSLSPRNPSIAGADSWEQRVLKEFEWRVAAGESADALEHGEVVNEPDGPMYRYMVALPVKPACLGCHGPEEALTPAVRAALAEEYPMRRDAPFAAGGIGGAITIKRRL